MTSVGMLFVFLAPVNTQINIIFMTEYLNIYIEIDKPKLNHLEMHGCYYKLSS